MYLLDTTHCSLILQGLPSAEAERTTLPYLSVATTVIVAGELLYMAENSARREANIAKVEKFLDDIVVFPLTRECMPYYGAIRAQVIKRLGPKEKAKRFKIKIERLGFSDNDLWIAALAKAFDLTLISVDRDFQRLKDAGIVDLKLEVW